MAGAEPCAHLLMVFGGEIKFRAWGIGAGSIFSEPHGPLVL